MRGATGPGLPTSARAAIVGAELRAEPLSAPAGERPKDTAAARATA